MHTRSRLRFFILLILPTALCLAQEKAVAPQHAPDGGTIERFTSIAIPPTSGAPFTATVNTEWIRHLPDGSTITLVNHRTVARDANGRVFQQRAYFVPNDGKHESGVSQIEISNPATHELYVCRTAEQVCRLQEFLGLAGPNGFVAATAGQPGVQTETLGTQTLSGLQTIGTRETQLLGAATIGNEAPILERKEFWYSPELGINLITKREDPKFSTQQNLEVTGIAQGEPDAKFFEPPAGYKIFDMRKPPEIPGGAAASQQ